MTLPVPSRRLVGGVTVLVPIAALAGLAPTLWPLCFLAGALLAVLATIDLARSLPRARTVQITAPATWRLTKDRPGDLSLTLYSNVYNLPASRLTLALPSYIDAPQEFVDLPGAPAGQALPVKWACLARRRVVFRGAIAAWETTSWAGLWQLRSRQPLPAELRVYPNLHADRHDLAALFLNRGAAGVQLRRVVGRGRDFERLREYQPGDSFDEIHWKGTAKRGRPITKVFQIERTQELYVIIDRSRLGARLIPSGGNSVTTLERFITAALVLLLAAHRQGDRFGLVTFDSQVRDFLRAGSGLRHYAACREVLHAASPTDCSPDFGEAFSLIATRLQKRALLLVLTDLADPVLAEEFTRNLSVLARRHVVVVNQLGTPGVAPLFSHPVQNNNEVYAQLAGHFQWRESREVAQRLRQQGVVSTVLANERLAAELVSQYFRVKRRQLL